MPDALHGFELLVRSVPAEPKYSYRLFTFVASRTESLRLEVSDDGTLPSLFDKESGREILPTVILTRVGSNVVHVHERRARKIDWERASECEIDHDIERQRRFFWGRRL